MKTCALQRRTSQFSELQPVSLRLKLDAGQMAHFGKQ